MRCAPSAEGGWWAGQKDAIAPSARAAAQLPLGRCRGHARGGRLGGCWKRFRWPRITVSHPSASLPPCRSRSPA
eukprot:1511881-Prymnesium_polylepis.2